MSDIGFCFLKACSALSARAETPESASVQPVQRVRREAGKHISTSPCSMRHAIHTHFSPVFMNLHEVSHLPDNFQGQQGNPVVGQKFDVM